MGDLTQVTTEGSCLQTGMETECRFLGLYIHHPAPPTLSLVFSIGIIFLTLALPVTQTAGAIPHALIQVLPLAALQQDLAAWRIPPHTTAPEEANLPMQEVQHVLHRSRGLVSEGMRILERTIGHSSRQGLVQPLHLYPL